MNDALQREVIGDHNVVKGTDYHLVYTLWRLLYKPSRIAFYQGNDLLDRPLTLLSGADVQASPVDTIIPLWVEDVDAQVDVWVQLKSTSSNWTLHRLLADETLVYNFIMNALRSRQDQREAQFEFVSQGAVNTVQIRSFVSNPALPQFTRQRERLDEILQQVATHLKNSHTSVGLPGRAELRDLSHGILLEVAEAKPQNIDTLVAQIISALTEFTGSREGGRSLANKLLGALLRDSAAAPEQAQPYDLAWLDHAAGMNISLRGLFDRSPLSACTEVSRQALPRDWGQGKLTIARVRLDNALQQFLDAPETAFVLIGSSNIGKSWAVATWCMQAPPGHVRLLLPGRNLDHVASSRPLSDLVAQAVAGFTQSQVSVDQIVDRLQAATSRTTPGAFVIVLDDLRPPHADLARYRTDLARLVAQARQVNAKIVLTCSKPLWELMNLNSEIPPEEIFYSQEESFEPAGPKEELRASRNLGWQHPNDRYPDDSLDDLSLNPESRPRHAVSFELSGLTSAEMKEIIRKRLSPADAARVEMHLTEPAFAALRNPYLLARYLDRHKQELSQNPSAIPIPIDVDALLDERVGQVLAWAASEVALGQSEILRAFNSFVQHLWAVRGSGQDDNTFAAAEVCFQRILGSKGQQVLVLLQQQGLLSALDRPGIAEPLVSARVFAVQLLNRLRSGTEWPQALGALDPATDNDVVVAILRAAAHETGRNLDPVSLSEALLLHDRLWLAGVCEGLAQGTPSDYRTLAFLTALNRSEPDSILVPEACHALGELAVRSRRAWKWVAAIYLSARPMERLMGARALAISIQYDHRRVEAAMRLRLQKAGTITERKRQRNYLNGALDPLQGIIDPAAAASADRILTRYNTELVLLEKCMPLEDADEEELRILRDADEARGRIATALGDNHVEALLHELSSGDVLTRYRAACALRFAAFERPMTVRTGLFSAIRREDDDIVLNRVLWCVFRPGGTDPDGLLDAITASRVANWQVPSGAAGQVLGIIGDFCELFSLAALRRAVNFLPRRLDAYPPWARAFLSETLAYAWWRISEVAGDDDGAREQLCAVATPDLLGVPKQFRIFAVWGAVVAELGVICADTSSASRLRGQHFAYPHSWLQFLTVDLSNFAREHAEHITRHARFSRLKRLLSMCLQQEKRASAGPHDQLLYQGRHLCSRHCLAMLVALVPSFNEPHLLLDAVPSGEHDLHTVYELFVEQGRMDEAVLHRARQLAGMAHEGSTHDMILERELCRYHLVLLDRGLDAAREEQGRVHLFLRDSDEGAEYLARVIASQPTQTLELLDRNFEGDRDLALIYYLQEQAQSWQLVLLTRVYARMFGRGQLRGTDATELCEQVLVALDGLPASQLADEYRSVYTKIRSALTGRPVAITSTPPRDSAVGRSHKTALDLLNGCSAVEPQRITSWITETVYSNRAWLEADQHLKDGTLSFWSMGNYLVCVFPAVRLATVAVGHRYGIPDPALRVMEDRIAVHRSYKEHYWVFRHEPQSDSAAEEWRRERVAKALEEFEVQLQSRPLDERLWAWKGHLLLLLHRSAEAKDALTHCLSLPWCIDDTRISAKYNLACAYAKLGMNDQCRAELEQVLKENASYKEHISTDPDFASVCKADWFLRLVDASPCSSS